MKKFLKIMAFAVMLIAVAGIMSSCKETFNVRVIYTASFIDHNLSGQEIENVNNYLLNHRIAVNGETVTYEVSSKNSLSDCYWSADNQSKADFEKCMASLDEEEIKTLIAPGKYFTYIWSRAEPSGGRVTVGQHGFRGYDE